MGGRPVLNEDLVNLPNWLVLKLRIEGDDAIGLDNVELLEYRHEYDSRYALLSRTLRFRDRAHDAGIRPYCVRHLFGWTLSRSRGTNAMAPANRNGNASRRLSCATVHANQRQPRRSLRSPHTSPPQPPRSIDVSCSPAIAEPGAGEPAWPSAPTPM